MSKKNRTSRGRVVVAVACAEALEGRRLLSAATLPRDVNTMPTDSDALRAGSAYGNSDQPGQVQLFEHVAYQGQLYFVQDDGVHGLELFRSDGTAGGTVLVKDIEPGRDSSYPTNLTVVNGLLYFQASNESGATAAWRTDGTEAGTVRLGGPTNMRFITAFAAGPDGSTLFGGFDYERAQFWRTDGTPGGTTLLKEAPTVSFGGGFDDTAISTPDATYFLANDSVWRSDGTAAGTYVVKQFQLYPAGPSPADMVFAEGRLFVVTRWSSLFMAQDNLYVLDGTVGNATLLKDFPLTQFDPPDDGNIQNLTVVGDTVYFSADDGVSGDELWAATASQVRKVKDVNAGVASSDPSDFAAYHGALYFAATTATSGRELWTSNGTPGGTRLVTELSPGAASSSPGALAVANDKLFFSVMPDSSTTRTGLFTSDGTAAGTQLVRWFDESDTVTREGDAVRYRPNGFIAVDGGQVLFTARDETAGAEVWTTDGSSVAAATHVVRDVFPGTADANPVFLGALGDRLLYFADDGKHGSELWATDGTAAGTVLVKDIRPGVASSNALSDHYGGGPPSPGAATSQYVFFTATNDGGDPQAWRTDGTAAGTIQLTTSLPGAITQWAVVDGKAYFRIGTGTTSVYYTSDGTPAGTVTAPGPRGTFPFMAKLGNARYGPGTDAANGTELYRYDQDPLHPDVVTATRVTDINPGAGSSNPTGIATVGDAVFFFAAGNDGNGNKLYKYTPATGAVVVKDGFPVSNFHEVEGWRNFGAFSGKYFFASGDNSRQLYVSDGTPAGTQLVSAPGSTENANDFIAAADGSLLFTGGFTKTLYRTDGTATGTVVLSPSLPTTNNVMAVLARIGNDVYFYSGDAFPYATLWRTDGTVAGTTLVAAPNAAGQLAATSDRLFFPALDFVHGFETWSTPIDVLTPPLVVQSGTFSPGPASLTFHANRPLAGNVDAAPYSRLDPKVTALAGGGVITTRRVATLNADGSVTFTFPGGLPADGWYRVALPAGSVFDTSGTPLARDFTFDFRVLRGDADNDGTVGPADFNLLASHFGQTGQTWATGDFDGDGTVGPADFNLLASRFGKTLPPPPNQALVVSSPSSDAQTRRTKRANPAGAATSVPAKPPARKIVVRKAAR